MRGKYVVVITQATLFAKSKTAVTRVVKLKNSQSLLINDFGTISTFL